MLRFNAKTRCPGSPGIKHLLTGLPELVMSEQCLLEVCRQHSFFGLRESMTKLRTPESSPISEFCKALDRSPCYLNLRQRNSHALQSAALCQEASLQHLWPSPEATTLPKDKSSSYTHRGTRLHPSGNRVWNRKSSCSINLARVRSLRTELVEVQDSCLPPPLLDQILDIPLRSGVRVPPRPFWLHAGWMHDLPLARLSASNADDLSFQTLKPTGTPA